MNDIRKVKDVITTLCSMSGVSGYETPVAEALKDAWTDLADEFSISKLGNLYALKKANTEMPGKPRKILFATHIDGIGMIVSGIIGEFLRFAPAGGFDPRILPGQFVDIHTKTGSICQRTGRYAGRNGLRPQSGQPRFSCSSYLLPAGIADVPA